MHPQAHKPLVQLTGCHCMREESISCLHFASQCGEVSKSGEGSTAHNKSSSSCRGEKVPHPPLIASLNRASVGLSHNTLRCSCSPAIRAIYKVTAVRGRIRGKKKTHKKPPGCRFKTRHFDMYKHHRLSDVFSFNRLCNDQTILILF